MYNVIKSHTYFLFAWWLIDRWRWRVFSGWDGMVAVVRMSTGMGGIVLCRALAVVRYNVKSCMQDTDWIFTWSDVLILWTIWLCMIIYGWWFPILYYYYINIIVSFFSSQNGNEWHENKRFIFIFYTYTYIVELLSFFQNIINNKLLWNSHS